MPKRLFEALAAVVVALGVGAGWADVGWADVQIVTSGTVTSVVDGDTLRARMTDGSERTVRIIGIDAPSGAPAECGGSDAKKALEDLVLGQAVTLTSDPAYGGTDAEGRFLFYADRPDGLDVGLETIRRGWSGASVSGNDFVRMEAYLDAEATAEEDRRGVWGDCGGDFHLTRAEELRAQRNSAKAFVRRFYRRISDDRFLSAWRMLRAPAKRRLGSYKAWKSGYRRSLGVSVLSTKARVSGGRALVDVRLRSRDRDACSGQVVRQYFKGEVTMTGSDGSSRISKFRVRKTRGKALRRSKSECPKPKPPPDCQGYSPCLPPGPDVDCAGGSGNGPRRVEGPVYVGGGDPYDLDRDGNGVGCES
jgi:endonuclease YncB( thermonuclease family)